MHNLNDLKIWNKAMDIAEKTYLLSANFPTEEKFGLTSQIRRSAAGSVPSNIAEGAGRNTKGEFKNFLCIANASFYELYTHFLLHRLEEEKVKPVSSEVFEVQKMNYALM